jgi:N-acetylglucosaminyldiphosphoundecaprenol N-acetyl-beta-D-mannosaminyltransferase
MDRQLVINFPISTGKYSLFVDEIVELGKIKESSIICVANVHMFIEAYKDNKFLDVVNNAKLITPDGRPLIWAMKLLYGIKQERVAGMDLLPDLLQRMELENAPVFFYGSTESTLENTRAYLESKYPKLKIAGFYSPPFGSHDDIHEEDIANKINDLKPAVIFVVLGCPKQEKWMAMMKDKVNAVMIGIGGALPVMLGMQKRAPVWMQKNGLEWLFRLSQEPRRLFRRYFSTNSFFLWILFKEFIRIKLLVPLGFSKNFTI